MERSIPPAPPYHNENKDVHLVISIQQCTGNFRQVNEAIKRKSLTNWKVVSETISIRK